MKTLALKSDPSTPLGTGGTIVCWGDDYYGVDELIPPAGNDFNAISAGYYYSLALKNDGTIVGWGGDWWGQVSDIPEGNDFVAISAGGFHIVTLTNDGRILSWGWNDYDPPPYPVPEGIVFARDVAAGWKFSVALKAR
ncbi:MAG: hypothetical protein ABII09_08230 [Planctomycetota bacterium]